MSCLVASLRAKLELIQFLEQEVDDLEQEKKLLAASAETRRRVSEVLEKLKACRNLISLTDLEKENALV